MSKEHKYEILPPKFLHFFYRQILTTSTTCHSTAYLKLNAHNAIESYLKILIQYHVTNEVDTIAGYDIDTISIRNLARSKETKHVCNYWVPTF